jgi:hypothetical protein
LHLPCTGFVSKFDVPERDQSSLIFLYAVLESGQLTTH